MMGVPFSPLYGFGFYATLNVSPCIAGAWPVASYLMIKCSERYLYVDVYVGDWVSSSCWAAL
jgi:hypothetical protein